MKKPATSSKSQTDWKRIDALQDEEIDLSETREIPPEMFAGAMVRRRLQEVRRKEQLTLRIDSDVVEWFKRQGQGYQTRINALLRAYVEAHKR